MQGLFLFHKPSGPSSARYVSQIKHALKLPRGVRIGHGGTLDPFASGLLVVGVSRSYTKLLDYQLHHTVKEYKAEIVLGATSDTDDRTGIIQNTNIDSCVHLSGWKEKIISAIEELKNQETQIPPQYSAIKIQGQPAYARKRAGETIALFSKKVSLIACELESIEEKNGLIFIVVTILVSSGFYIRSFARDLGQSLGCGGYVNALERVKIGHFSLKNALILDDLEKSVELSFRATGAVQNVGFRVFAKSVADELGVTGFCKNINAKQVRDDSNSNANGGDVYLMPFANSRELANEGNIMKNAGIEIVGQGKLSQLQEFLIKISVGPVGAHIEFKEDWFGSVAEEYKNFSIK